MLTRSRGKGEKKHNSYITENHKTNALYIDTTALSLDAERSKFKVLLPVNQKSSDVQ